MWSLSLLLLLAVGMVITIARTNYHLDPIAACTAKVCEPGTQCRIIFNNKTNAMTPECFEPCNIPDDPNPERCGPAVLPLLTLLENSTRLQPVVKLFQCSGFCPSSGFVCKSGVCCVVTEVFEKPGQCPVPQPDHVTVCTITCRHDEECPDFQKCCRTGCGGFKCTAPQLDMTCANMFCVFDATCREVLDRTTGLVSPRCLKNPPRIDDTCKRGTALLVAGLKEEIVTAICGRRSDRVNCPLGFGCEMAEGNKRQICCPNSSPIITPLVKPGICPFARRADSECANRCYDDSECPGHQKCCGTTCGGNVCLEPLPESLTCAVVDCQPEFICVDTPQGPNCIWSSNSKPGECPVYPCAPPPNLDSRDVVVPSCTPECTSDFECPESQKCCNVCSRCGKSCVAPPRPSSCQALKCPPGQTCVMVQTECRLTTPCLTQPTCIHSKPACNLQCKEGFICEMVELPCRVPPCPSSPQCVLK